ncbi:MAG: FHA domain-containing protein [Deltaproteobacteria bacterium]|nr:FHA domain-containing protein [Deltaproteobacteria bacterium]
MWKLTIVDDEGTRTVLPLARGEYTVGRDPENTVRLTERNISRKHLILRRDDADWIVEDLNSYNGCFVNGLRVSGTHPLHDGDLLQVGDYRLELADEEKTAEESDAPTAEAAPAPPVVKLTDRPDRLVVVDGAAAGTEFPLEKDRMILGRAEDADVSINHSSVSRIHAEITRITAGTYEIVDCGSSNGIRVNGIKLDRRVIEDDDEIEMGDVRLRFVARGRIFRPGTSPRATTSFAPSAAVPVAPAPRKSLGLMMAIGALLGVAFVVAVLMLRPKTEPTQAQPTSAQGDESPAITEAKRLAATGDLEAAHNKLTSEIAESSPLRDNPEVKRIEGQWADAQMQKAAQETDPAKKRALYASVAGARLVDADKRKAASDELGKLDNGGIDPGTLPPVAARADAAVAPTGDKTPGATTTDPGKPLPTGIAPADTSKDKPPSKDKTPAGKDKTGGNPDIGATVLEDGEAKARKALEPRVWSGRATVDEVRMLKAICRHQKDSACVARANQMLQQMQNNQ